jgi:hypothetical protein
LKAARQRSPTGEAKAQILCENWYYTISSSQLHYADPMELWIIQAHYYKYDAPTERSLGRCE